MKNMGPSVLNLGRQTVWISQNFKKNYSSDFEDIKRSENHQPSCSNLHTKCTWEQTGEGVLPPNPFYSECRKFMESVVLANYASGSGLQKRHCDVLQTMRIFSLINRRASKILLANDTSGLAYRKRHW